MGNMVVYETLFSVSSSNAYFAVYYAVPLIADILFHFCFSPIAHALYADQMPQRGYHNSCGSAVAVVPGLSGILQDNPQELRKCNQKFVLILHYIGYYQSFLYSLNVRFTSQRIIDVACFSQVL